MLNNPIEARKIVRHTKVNYFGILLPLTCLLLFTISLFLVNKTNNYTKKTNEMRISIENIQREETEIRRNKEHLTNLIENLDAQIKDLENALN